MVAWVDPKADTSSLVLKIVDFIGRNIDIDWRDGSISRRTQRAIVGLIRPSARP